MKRLLIVDDEHHIVNWLGDLFEEQSEIELIIFKAYNGKDALKILKNTKIDIVLLDIKMPGIDGLQVSEQILADWPGCQIIFLTGYDCFDYVYFANQNKHINYLLKTEDDEKIIQAVINAAAAIDKEMHQLEIELQVTANERLVHQLIQRDYLRKFIRGKKTEEITAFSGKSELDLELQMDQPVFLLYGKINTSGTECDVSHEAIILPAIQVIEQELYQKYHYAVIDFDESTILWLLQPACGCHDPLLYIKEAFDNIIALYKNNFDREIMLLLYHKAVSWDNVYNVFLLLNEFALMGQSVDAFASYGMIYRENEKQEEVKGERIISNWETLLDEMPQYLKRGEGRQFAHLLKQIKFSCRSIKSMHYLPVIGVYQRISSMLIFYINTNHLVENIAHQIGLYPLYFIYDFKDWWEAFGYLERLTGILFALDNDNQADSNQRLVITVKDYISSHLADNLTLTVLADVVNYNSSYVSRVFKQITGMKLSDYITLCRIRKAKELLLDTEENVHDIAKKVGFDTSQYFSAVFRKEVCMTPGEFRRQKV